MSNTEHSPRTNPMASMIALQRQSIKQGQQMLSQSMNAQKRAPRMWKDAIDSQRSGSKIFETIAVMGAGNPKKVLALSGDFCAGRG